MAETEILARRMKWTAQEEAALLAEVDAEGGRVAMVARPARVVREPALQLALGGQGVSSDERA